MAKGNTCPGCGEQTLHSKDGVYECSSCGSVGWQKPGLSGSGGKGAKCKACGRQQLHTIYNGKITVRFCTGCEWALVS